MKKVTMVTSAIISSPTIVFQHDALHSTNNKAIQNVIRVD
jgi:hypothetical protein